MPTSCVCPPENIKSPVTDVQVEFSAIDPLFSKEEGAATGKNSSNLLSIARMPPTPSLEDVASLTDYPDVSRSFSKDSSESDEGFNDGEGKVVNESLDSLASHDDSVSSARTKRERYHTTWQPSIGKGRESDNQSERSKVDPLMSKGIKMKMRLMDIKGVSDSDSNLITRQGKAWSQSSAGRLSSSVSELLPSEGGREEAGRRRHIYKATGKSCERRREGEGGREEELEDGNCSISHLL